MMTGFEKVAGIDEVEPGNPKRARVQSTEVVLFNIDGQIHAVENNCPHQHFAMLHAGTLEGCHLTCPMHGWTFDLTTGKSTNGNGALKKFQVRIENGQVWVEQPRPGTYALFP